MSDMDLAVSSLVSVSQAKMDSWDWEQFVSTGLVAREYKDFSQWILGRLALGVTTKYGENVLGKFAFEVGLNLKTMQRYRWVVKNFPKVQADDTKRLPFYAYEAMVTLENPQEWIDRAASEDWSPYTLVEKVREYKNAQEGVVVVPKHSCPKCGYSW
jgi:hypothetical protein